MIKNMFEYPFTRYLSFKETNTIKSPKEYIARKKAKSASQNYKGTKKDRENDFKPNGRLYA
jgi:hypothetical protein